MRTTRDRQHRHRCKKNAGSPLQVHDGLLSKGRRTSFSDFEAQDMLTEFAPTNRVELRKSASYTPMLFTVRDLRPPAGRISERVCPYRLHRCSSCPESRSRLRGPSGRSPRCDRRVRIALSAGSTSIDYLTFHSMDPVSGETPARTRCFHLLQRPPHPCPLFWART